MYINIETVSKLLTQSVKKLSDKHLAILLENILSVLGSSDNIEKLIANLDSPENYTSPGGFKVGDSVLVNTEYLAKAYVEYAVKHNTMLDGKVVGIVTKVNPLNNYLSVNIIKENNDGISILDVEEVYEPNLTKHVIV